MHILESCQFNKAKNWGNAMHFSVVVLLYDIVQDRNVRYLACL